MLGPVMKSVESVLGPGESLRWERFVKEVESEGVMDGESDEPTDGEDKASQR